MSTADRPGSKRPWFRRRRILAVALLAAAPWICLLAGNGWLASPWGRHWLAGKISARTGLETHIDGASVTPWSGICLRGLVVEQPADLRGQIQQPLATVDSIRAWPAWKSWLHRRWELRSVEVESPKAVLPIRWLSHLAPLQSAPSPSVAAARPSEAPPSVAPRPSTLPVTPQALPVIPETPDAPRIPTLTVSLSEPPPIVPGETTPTAWITIRGGSVALVTEGIPEPLFEVIGIDAALPVAGGPAESSLLVGNLGGMGAGLASQVRVPLQWQPPILFFGPTDSGFAGLTWRFGGKVGFLPGLPVEIESEAPLQTDHQWTLPSQGECRVREYRSTARFAGYLRQPFTWRGEAQMEASGISLTLPGQPACNFDRGAATIRMANGILNCPDARLIGDNLSLLGNATAIPDGRAAGVLRIVAEPSFASGLASHFQQSGKHLAFSQLGTPDRLAADVQLAANGEGAFIQLGQGGDVMTAKDAIQVIRNGRQK